MGLQEPHVAVHQSSATTGTGNFTLTATLAPQQGRQTFDQAYGHTSGNDYFEYFIMNQSAAEWEHGTGHMSSSTVLVRDTVISSSNSGALVNFGSGTKDVTSGPSPRRFRRLLDADVTLYVRTVAANVTHGIASPGVITWTGHGLSANDPVVFSRPPDRCSDMGEGTAPTITIASPAVIHSVGHGYAANDEIAFMTTGALPTGIRPQDYDGFVGPFSYFVKTVIDADNFTISATSGGSAINTSGSQSGIHYCQRYYQSSESNIEPGEIFYVKTVLGANTFTISQTPGGTAIDFSVSSAGQRLTACTGKDTNKGTNNTTDAFLNIEAAANYAAHNFDFNNDSTVELTIQLADSTYLDITGNLGGTGNLYFPAQYGMLNGCIIKGNAGEGRGNCIIWGACNVAGGIGCYYTFQTIRFGINVYGGGFSHGVSRGVRVSNPGSFALVNSSEFVRCGLPLFNSNYGAMDTGGAGITVINDHLQNFIFSDLYSNTFAGFLDLWFYNQTDDHQFNEGFGDPTAPLVFVETYAWCYFGHNTFNRQPGFRGSRYEVDSNAIVDTDGGGATYIPGDISGVTSQGGAYY